MFIYRENEGDGSSRGRKFLESGFGSSLLLLEIEVQGIEGMLSCSCLSQLSRHGGCLLRPAVRFCEVA